jgi:FMN-dependent NADH-azoreductase
MGKKRVSKKILRMSHIQKDFLSVLKRCSPEELESMLKFINKEGRDTLYASIYNCMYNSNLPDNLKGVICNLKSHRKTLEYLSKSSNDENKKKKILLQRGGQFLAPILSAAIPLLANWLFGKK